MRNENIITADKEGKLFYIDEEYQCNVIQNNVNTQKTLDIVFINEHQFIDIVRIIQFIFGLTNK